MTSIKTEIEKWNEKLVQRAFEKAKADSQESTANGLSNYLSNQIEIKFGHRIEKKTFNRHYLIFVSKTEKRKVNPRKFVKDALSEFIGYKNFKDFIKKNETEIEKIRRENEKRYGELKKKIKQSLALNFLFLASLIFFISKYYKKNCMIWTGNKYEKVRCSGLEYEVRLDPIKLEKMEEIEICDTIIFKKNGRQLIWYDKFNNELSYFTFSGEHPINGRTLKSLTQDIIDAHAKPCDSIKLLNE